MRRQKNLFGRRRHSKGETQLGFIIMDDRRKLRIGFFYMINWTHYKRFICSQTLLGYPHWRQNGTKSYSSLLTGFGMILAVLETSLATHQVSPLELILSALF